MYNKTKWSCAPFVMLSLDSSLCTPTPPFPASLYSKCSSLLGAKSILVLHWVEEEKCVLGFSSVHRAACRLNSWLKDKCGASPGRGSIVRQLRSWSQPQPPCIKLQKEGEIWEGPLHLSGENTTVNASSLSLQSYRQKSKNPCSSEKWFLKNFILFNHPFISKPQFVPIDPICVSLAEGWPVSLAKCIRSVLEWWYWMCFSEDESLLVGFKGWDFTPPLPWMALEQPAHGYRGVSQEGSKSCVDVAPGDTT